MGVSPEQVAAVARLKVFFGHQSVGQDIVDGLGDLRQGGALRALQVTEIRPGEAAGVPVGFAHGRVGRNKAPDSKMRDFARYVADNAAAGLDVAFFKFCFLDVDEATDVERLFESYRAFMRDLEREYPRIRFVHVTVPLSNVRGGWRALAKSVLGRLDRERVRNARRAAYNDLLRREYATSGSLFDLAAAESTLPGGGRAMFEAGGVRYEMLAPQFTDDGAHLNRAGRGIVAGRMLFFLAAVTR